MLPNNILNKLITQLDFLTAACAQVERCDGQHCAEYPVYAPTFSTLESERHSLPARRAAIDSICQLFLRSRGVSEVPFLQTALLCGSNELIDSIHQLNLAKIEFQAVIAEIRSLEKRKGMHADQITDNVLQAFAREGYRSSAMQEAFTREGIGALNLQKCFAKINVLEPNVDVFSWTWATNHSRTKKVTHAEAVKLVYSLNESHAKLAEMAFAELAKDDSNTLYVSRVKQPNQLRANYAFKLEREVIRKSCAVSGVVVLNQKNMPRKHWREDPRDAPRLQRNSSIEDEPFIGILNLYRYKQ